MKINFALNSIINIINATDIKNIDYHIAMILFEFYEKIPSMTMSELAGKCNVSVSVLRKFITNVYGSTFQNFKDDVSTSIPIRKQQMRERYLRSDQKLLAHQLFPLTTNQTYEEFKNTDQIKRICQMILTNQKELLCMEVLHYYNYLMIFKWI